MYYDADKRDLRIIKTEKALNEAIYTLLTNHNFRKITVRDICEEALISRATFYSYYMDKYDLLRSWLSSVLPKDLNVYDSYESLEKIINQFVNEYKTIIKNIIENADNETVDVALDCVFGLLKLDVERRHDKNGDLKFMVFSNFLAGGIIYYLSWHVRNRFPSDVMNIYLYDIITKFRGWQAQ